MNSIELESESSTQHLALDPEILKKAEKGNSFAQLDVGKASYFSSNQNYNMKQAFFWLTLSAEQGNMEAQFRLGDIYALGDGTDKSEFIAYNWYLKSAIQGYPKALTRLHNLYHAEKSMYCRGQRSSKEEKWTTADFKNENNIRELYEYRVQQLETRLTKIKDYFTKLLVACREHISDDEVEDKQDDYLNLGFLYQHGYGIRKIKTRAIEFYALAAEKGNVDAAYNLGHIYHHNPKIKWNYPNAFRWYKQAAEKGHIHACNDLAFLYLKGLGTDIDYSKAIDLYTKAAKNCNVNAMISLAKIYRQGEIVEKNYEKSAEWYNKAVIAGSTVAQSCLELLYINEHLSLNEFDIQPEKGSPKLYSKRGLYSKLRSDISNVTKSTGLEKLKKLAMNAMKRDGYAMLEIGMKYYNGDVFAQDKDIAFKWIKNAAKSGITTIQCAVAKKYKDGDYVEQDYHKASIWYEKAARKGDNNAQYNLGLMYYHGLGVREDPLEASKWYTFAANKNNSDAQCQLGILRENGEGLRKDLPDAFSWFSASVRQNNPQAVYRLARMYEKNSMEKNDPKLAVSLYEKAARLGSVDAQLRLADMYFKKESHYQDKQTAFEYYEMAANQGDPKSKYELAKMYLHGKDVQEDFTQAYRLFKESSELGYANSARKFKIPIDFSKTDYGAVATMFIFVCRNGIDSLEYNLGNYYDTMGTYKHGLYFLSIPTVSYKQYWYEAAAKKDVPGAHNILATIYDDKKIISNAVKHYKRAHELGDTYATYKLAFMYLEGYGVPQNFIKAFFLLHEASEKRQEDACKVLNFFENGDPDINNGLVKTMFEASAKSGHTLSQYKLGLLESSDQNIHEAIKWLYMASKGGFIEASYRLASLLENTVEIEEDYQEITRLYKVAGDKGHEKALFRLAQLYHVGDKVEIDYSKAYEFYTLAAQQGHQPAQLVTNITTESIWNDNKNKLNYDLETQYLGYGSFFRMWEHIADEGNIDLQYKLGVVYEKNGGDSNVVQAAKWYSKAACGSHKNALYSLGRLYDTGLGVGRDYRKAIELYERSSDLNNYQAVYQLGVIYEYGKGVKPNFEIAHYYYMRSAKKENSAAQFALGSLYEEGKHLPQNKLEALKWYSLSASQGNKDAESYLTTHYYETYDDTLFYSRKFGLFTRIKKLCHQANQQNNPFLGSFYYKFGYMHHCGYGTPINYKEAWEYYWKASVHYGDQGARNILTIKYENIDISIKDSYLKKLEMFEALIEQLLAEDIYELGSIYYHGVYLKQSDSLIDKAQVVVQPDYHKASKYFRMITERDLKEIGDYYMDCNFYLGMLYFVDVKQTNNSSKAQYYFSKALNSGAFNAQPFLDYINDENSNELDEAVLFEEAFKWHKENQNTANTKIILNIGWMYDKGLGTQQSYERAIYYYKILTENDYTARYLKSRHDYSSKSSVEGGYATYIDWYTKAANKSHIVANYNIGNIYFNEKDYQLAFQYYKVAADKGYSNAQFQIGVLYDKGYGIEQNYTMAIKWYTKAAEQSYVIANYNLGNLYFFRDYKLAKQYYTIAANQGNSDAQVQLGVLYENGYGTEQDHTAAIEWYSKAANQSHAIASYNLGNLYKKVKNNTKLALQYFKDATVQGNTNVQHKLVYTYMEILGIAVELFGKITINHLSPVSNEDDDAIVMLGGLYHSVSNATRDFSKALHCYKNTSRNSIYWSYALRGIGLLYEHGDGVERSYEKAFDYYSQSANSQNKGAYYNIALLYYYGKGVEKNYAIALDWLKRVVEVEPDKNNVYVLIRIKKTTKHNPPAAKKKEYSMVSETDICREAHHYLSLMYNKGQGTDKDYEKALYHFKIATSKEVKRS